VSPSPDGRRVGRSFWRSLLARLVGHSFFISYATENIDYARRLYRRLSSAGALVFMDEIEAASDLRRSEDGESSDIDQRLRRAIGGSSFFVFVHTESSSRKTTPLNEFRTAIALRKRIIRIEQGEPEGNRLPPLADGMSDHGYRYLESRARFGEGVPSDEIVGHLLAHRDWKRYWPTLVVGTAAVAALASCTASAYVWIQHGRNQLDETPVTMDAIRGGQRLFGVWAPLFQFLSPTSIVDIRTRLTEASGAVVGISSFPTEASCLLGDALAQPGAPIPGVSSDVRRLADETVKVRLYRTIGADPSKRWLMLASYTEPHTNVLIFNTQQPSGVSASPEARGQLPPDGAAMIDARLCSFAFTNDEQLALGLQPNGETDSRSASKGTVQLLALPFAVQIGQPIPLVGRTPSKIIPGRSEWTVTTEQGSERLAVFPRLPRLWAGQANRRIEDGWFVPSSDAFMVVYTSPGGGARCDWNDLGLKCVVADSGSETREVSALGNWRTTHSIRMASTQLNIFDGTRHFMDTTVSGTYLDLRLGTAPHTLQCLSYDALANVVILSTIELDSSAFATFPKGRQ
jgi:hypothetical protein